MKLSILVLRLCFIYVLCINSVFGDTNSSLNESETEQLSLIKNIGLKNGNHNELTYQLSIEEQDAIVVEKVLIHSIKTLQKSMRIVSTLIRITADTTGGVVGVLAKTVGGLINLVGSLLLWISQHLQWSTGPGMQVRRLINSTVTVLSGAGDFCVWGGEIAESLASSFGQAIQDSFRGLEAIPIATECFVRFLFHQQYCSHAHLEDTSPVFEQKDVRQESHHNRANFSQVEFDALLHQQNIMYHSQHLGAQPPSQEDRGPPAVQRGGKPLGLLRFEHLSGRHSTKASFKVAQDVRSLFNEADLSQFNATRGDVQSVRNNRTTFIELFSAASHFCFQQAPNVMGTIAQFTTSSTESWWSEDAPEGPSIGPCLLLGLLVVSIVNLTEYSSVRRRVAALMACSLLVWVGIVLIEQEQRLRLVKRTTIKSIHSYLEKQTLDQTLTTLSRNSTSVPPYEHALWLNVFVGALWNIDSTGGAGAFISHIFEEAVSLELSKVPPTIASARLKHFDLGSSAPKIRGIRVVSVSDEVCLTRFDVRRSHLQRKSRGREPNVYEGVLEYLMQALPAARDKSFSSPFASTDNRKKGRGDVFVSSCGEVVVEVDFVFASRDMAVELSLRSADSHSVLPDLASATLSEVVLAGQLRLCIQLTEDYPFLGNATASFLEPPAVDFTVSSFGGLDLSAIPLAFHWMNGTIHWLLLQYTHPLNTPLDLRHTICPDCDASAAKTAREALLENAQRIGRAVVQSVAALERFVGRLPTQATVIHLQSMCKRGASVVREIVSGLFLNKLALRLAHRLTFLTLRLTETMARWPETVPHALSTASVELPDTIEATPSPTASRQPHWSGLIRRALLVEDGWDLQEFEELFAH